MHQFINLVKAYRLYFILVAFFEIIFFLLNFKGNYVRLRNNKKMTDSIPTPYLFLFNIYLFLKSKKIKSFIDLGCGEGRVIYFFNKFLKIKYVGIEYYKNSFIFCRSLFKKNKNVKIINDNFLSKNITFNHDVYFINDPFKKNSDFKKLISKINNSNKKNKKIYLIFVNINKTKLKILNKFYLNKYIAINTRGFFIYSNIINNV